MIGLFGMLYSGGSMKAAAAQSADGKTTGEMAQTTAPSGDVSTATEYLAPLHDVRPFNLGDGWAERLGSVGISPDTLWMADRTTMTEEEQRSLTARRHYFMGWYYMEMERPARAIEEFIQAVEFDPDNSMIMLDAARARLALRETAQAQELLTRILETETTNVEALRLQAETYLGAADAAPGNEKESLVISAVESLEKARKLQPKNLEVLRSLAKAYLQQQEVGKVISVYKDIVEVDPRDTYSLLILAQVLSRMDRPEEAIQYYQKVIDQRRGFIGGYIYLGQLYERLKRYGDALDLYKQALLVEPRNVDLLRRFEELVQQIHGIRNPEAVLGEYEKFVEEYPGNTEIRRVLAQRYEGDEMTEKAIEQYEAILEIDSENLDACIALSRIYTTANDHTQAEKYLQRAIEIDPEKTDLYDAIAATMLAREDVEGAIAVYKRALEINPNTEKLYINLAALLENEKQTTAAVTTMEQAVEKVGDKPELLAVLGKFYRALDQTDKAEATLRKAYDLESGNLPLFGELLSLYLEDGNTTAAAEVTSTTADANTQPRDVVLSVSAEFHFNAGYTDRAIALYEQALKEKPLELDYLARLVGLSNRQKAYDASLEYVKEYGPRQENQNTVRQIEAEIYNAAGRHDEALEIYRELLAENPLDLNYYQRLIDALNDAGKYDESIKVVERAATRFGNSDPEEILMMKGLVYYKQKKYTQAKDAFRELIDRSSGRGDDGHYLLGSVYLDEEKYDSAEQEFRKAIDINPNSADALNALGYMYADRGIKLDEAKELITQALDLKPNAPHILDSMGWVLYKKGEVDRAATYIERAARHYDDAEILAHLGEIYFTQGKKEEARDLFERVLEMEPDREEIREKLKRISLNGPQ